MFFLFFFLALLTRSSRVKGQISLRYSYSPGGGPYEMGGDARRKF